MSELKPCPFCGYKLVTLHIDGFGETVHRVCMKCGARTRPFDTEQEATKAWNRRADNANDTE